MILNATAHKTSSSPIALLLGFALVLFAAHAVYTSAMVDDAYIFFRYAQHFADGHGLVFNVGERVEGYTSPLWVLILGLFAAFGTNLPAVAVVLGVALSLATMFLAYKLAGLFDFRHPLLRVLPVLLLSANGSFATWVTGGLETMLLTFLVTLAAYLYLQHGHWLLLSLIWSLIYLTRPEGALLFAITAAALAFQARRHQRRWREAVSFGVIVVGVITFHILWRLSYYGYPLPNTYYAKVSTGSIDQLLRGGYYLAYFLVAYGAALLGLVVLARRRFPAPYLLALVGGQVVYVLLVGGDGLWQFRFLMPVLALLYVTAAWGWDKIIPRYPYPYLAIMGLVIVTLLPTRQGGVKLVAMDVPNYTDFLVARIFDNSLALAGQWLKANTHPDTVIAVSAAGYIPFYAERPTLDMFGLTDATIAHLPTNIGSGQAGHEKWSGAYVLQRRPDIIVFQTAIPVHGICNRTREDIVTNYPPFGVFNDLYASDEFWQNYKPMCADLEDGLVLNYFLRADSEATS